jgi:hypothetical protein
MLEDGLVARLYADATITNIIGTSGQYPAPLPQDAKLPALTYKIEYGSDQDGRQLQSVQKRLIMTRVIYSAFGEGVTGYSDAVRLKKAVLANLLDFSGTLPDSDATRVSDILYDTEKDDFTGARRGYVRDFQVIVWHTS